jgi:hypothetical protein
MRDEWTIRSPCLGSGENAKRTGLAVVDEDTEPSGGQYARISVGGECAAAPNTILH